MIRKHNIVLLVGTHFPGRSSGRWENYMGGLGIVINKSMDGGWFFVLVDDDPQNAEWYHESNIEPLGSNVDKAAVDDVWHRGGTWDRRSY